MCRMYYTAEVDGWRSSHVGIWLIFVVFMDSVDIGLFIIWAMSAVVDISTASVK